MPHDEQKMTRETPKNKALQLIDKRLRFKGLSPRCPGETIAVGSFFVRT